MARVVVVEDEPDLQKVLEFNLRLAGHAVSVAGGGRDGIDLARTHKPDLLLLDLMLPDIPGTEVCRALRGDPHIQGLAIVILTAKAEEIDRVVGLELGADDYISKPFSMRELLLRIEAVLRRNQPSKGSAEYIDFGELRIDREAFRAWVSEQELDLTTLEFKLLVVLFDRRNRVQTRSALLDTVWGIHSDITTRTVDTHVKRLREKLGPASDYIETVRGVGYRFVDSPGEAMR
jgi:two-component system, OmpR family, phosphate regulon response regulator PhoB